MRVGIDTGGTFTDIVWVQDGAIRTAKVPSTPSSPVEAVLNGLAEVPSIAQLVCHGTTVGTNAVLSRTGGPAAIVVTSGFRDVLRIGRGERDNLYSIDPHRPSPLIQRDKTFEINLRLDHRGHVLATPDSGEIQQLAKILKESGVQAIAVGILHSAKHPAMEIELAEKLAELTGLPVFASSKIAAQPREYERWTAGSLAAYLAPILGDYLSKLAEKCPARLALMASSGGLISPEQVLSNPALCVLSGPAGGAIAAMSVGGHNTLALDMGGTSTDVTLLTERLPRTREATVAGIPVPLPSIDIHTIGAGGGSIVKFDKGGMLGLGPASAGADPGPACYGRGGPATLTDAIILSGRLYAPQFMGGKMPLDVSESIRALEGICPSGMSMDELLDGVTELAKVHLVGALRKISVARGIDPSAPPEPFTLVPFGGAGALFAVECAREMGLRNVIHPAAAGVFSALGLVSSPIAVERERTALLTLGDSVEPIVKLQNELTDEVGRELSTWGQEDKPAYSTVAECRYVGQTHTLDIPFNPLDSIESLREAFASAYLARFTYLHPDTEIEITSIRVRGEIQAPAIEFPDIPNKGREIKSAMIDTIRIRTDRQWIEAPVYVRDQIPIDFPITAPALIVENFSTLYLPPESSMHINRKGHAIIASTV